MEETERGNLFADGLKNLIKILKSLLKILVSLFCIKLFRLCAFLPILKSWNNFFLREYRGIQSVDQRNR